MTEIEQPTSDQGVNTNWYSLNTRGYRLNTEHPEPIEQTGHAIHSMVEHLAGNSKQTEQPEIVNSEVFSEHPQLNTRYSVLIEQMAADIDAIQSLCYSAIQSNDPRPYLVKIMNILEGVRE